QRRQVALAVLRELGLQPAGEVRGQHLGGGVRDRQEHHVVPREDVPPVPVPHLDLAVRLAELEERVVERQQHLVIDLVHQPPHDPLQRDEVEDVAVLVQLALDLDPRAVVVAVQPLALVAVGDEVPGGEHEVVLLYDDSIRGHLGPPWVGRAAPGDCSRKWTKSVAAVRSAVVPGLSALPSRRSDASNRASASRRSTLSGSPAASTRAASRLTSRAAPSPHLRAISESGTAASSERYVSVTAAAQPSPRSRARHSAGTPVSKVTA